MACHEILGESVLAHMGQLPIRGARLITDELSGRLTIHLDGKPVVMEGLTLQLSDGRRMVLGLARLERATITMTVLPVYNHELGEATLFEMQEGSDNPVVAQPAVKADMLGARM